jgi:hypothetical protein
MKGRAPIAALVLGAALTGCSSSPPSAPAEPSYDASAPSGGEPDSYSAVVVRTFEQSGGQTETRARVARRGDWSRQDWDEGGRHLEALVRPDLGHTFLVDVDRNVCVETALGPPAPDAESGDLTGEGIEVLMAGGGTGAAVTCERAGTETIDGHPCAVYRSHIEAPGGGSTESTVWEATDLGGLALRSELRGSDGSRVVTELRDVQVPADEALFEPPTARRAASLGAP